MLDRQFTESKTVLLRWTGTERFFNDSKVPNQFRIILIKKYKNGDRPEKKLSRVEGNPIGSYLRTKTRSDCSKMKKIKKKIRLLLRRKTLHRYSGKCAESSESFCESEYLRETILIARTDGTQFVNRKRNRARVLGHVPSRKVIFQLFHRPTPLVAHSTFNLEARRKSRLKKIEN